MPIPKKINYIGSDYTVELESKVTAKSGSMGLVDHAEQAIYINCDISPQMQAETCLHELVHVIDNKFAIELDETQVLRLSMGFYGLLRENPKLVQALME
jgi:hypothetical protein